MTQAFIVTGPQNSGLGDNPVVAGNKINSNFNELYAAIPTQAIVATLLYPNSVYDTSQTVSLIGNTGDYATNLWSSTGTVGTRTAEFSNAFEYIATGGGTYNTSDSAFGVALFGGAKLTAGSRGIWAGNFVTEVDIARQNQAYALEADISNNSGADCGLTSNGYDQMGAVLAGSGGAYSPLFAFQCLATAQASRFQIGAQITNWKSFGIQIIQDPVGIPAGASTAVTGPCLLMQASSIGGTQPILRLLDSAAGMNWQVLQNGSQQFANGAVLEWITSISPKTAPLVIFAMAGNGSVDFTYVQTASASSATSIGYLCDHNQLPTLTWGSSVISFFNATPIAQPTTASAAATFVQVDTTTAVSTDSTFDGYTLRQVVKAIRNLGLLA